MKIIKLFIIKQMQVTCTSNRSITRDLCHSTAEVKFIDCMWPGFLEGNGYEARQTSKEQTKMPRFLLEGPRPCAIFCLNAHALCINYITKTFLLVIS